MTNNNQENNGKSNGFKNLFKPVVSINIPVETSTEKLNEVLNVLGITETPLPPLEQIDQINLQITLNFRQTSNSDRTV